MDLVEDVSKTILATFWIVYYELRIAMTTLQRVEKLATLHKTVEFLEGWQEQVKKESLVDTFLRLMTQEKKTAAKAALEKIKQKSENSPWRKGYINALEGMITVSEAKNDQNILMNQVEARKSDELRKALLQHSSNELHSDFDRGFFSAWADYVRALKKRTVK